MDTYLHKVTEEMSHEVTRFTECQVLTLKDKIYRYIFFGSGPCHGGWDCSPAQWLIISSVGVLNLPLSAPLIFQ